MTLTYKHILGSPCRIVCVVKTAYEYRQKFLQSTMYVEQLRVLLFSMV